MIGVNIIIALVAALVGFWLGILAADKQIQRLFIKSDRYRKKVMKPFNLEEYLANPSRKVVTRDGRNVKIHCTNYYLGNRCIIAEVEGFDSSYSFNNRGLLYGTMDDSPLDLFFAPEKKEGWINIFKGASDNRFLGYTCIFKTKENAEEGRKGVSGYITTIKIEWEEQI